MELTQCKVGTTCSTRYGTWSLHNVRSVLHVARDMELWSLHNVRSVLYVAREFFFADNELPIVI